MNQNEEESTPDLEDLQQNNEHEAFIEVPVRVVDIGSVQVHHLPARDAISRSTTVSNSPQQLVGANLRRSKFTLWATAASASGFVYVGTDLNEVESGTCAMLPAPVDTMADGVPPMLTMTHARQVWVRNSGANPVTVNFVAEDWAD